MVDRLKDSTDRKLESMFSSAPVPDDGFSVGVMRRLKRRVWIRRLSLPVAIVIGGAIALKPLSQLVVTFGKLLAFLPGNIKSLSLDVPQGSTILLGALLALVLVVATRMLEE